MDSEGIRAGSGTKEGDGEEFGVAGEVGVGGEDGGVVGVGGGADHHVDVAGGCAIGATDVVIGGGEDEGFVDEGESVKKFKTLSEAVKNMDV